MNEPVCAQKAPFALELEAGTYWWCACGRSQKQPFCDGSHQGTGFAPVKLELGSPQKVWLCGCKRTARPPHCDGTHAKL